MKLLVYPMQAPCAIVTLPKGEEPCSTGYLGIMVKTPGNGLASASPQCECVKLLRTCSVSNTGHKRQNSV